MERNRIRIKFSLTLAQTRALLYALGNSISVRDDMIAIFAGDKKEIEDCYKAQQRIADALSKTLNKYPEP
jgi:hypothetical protein